MAAEATDIHNESNIYSESHESSDGGDEYVNEAEYAKDHSASWDVEEPEFPEAPTYENDDVGDDLQAERMAPAASASGLSPEQRIACRECVVQAAKLACAHEPEIHYTQDIHLRWDGINRRRNAALGQYPSYADCSSFATWCLWNGLYLKYHLPDKVNGKNWSAGNTGTMTSHGLGVSIDPQSILPGDCVFYRKDAGGPISHVAIVVSKLRGVPMVVSHGSEKGPTYRKYNYRTPVQIRRYI